MPVERDPLQAYLDNAATRQAELDALSASTIANAAKTITDLQNLNNSAVAETPTYEKGSKVYNGKTYSTAAGAYSAAVADARKAGEPYPAPKGTHWTLIGTEWKLYQDMGSSGNTGSTSGTGSAGGNTADASTQALIQSLQAQIAAMTAANTKATETQRQSAIAALTDRFTKYGLGSLVNKIKELAVDGATEATITLALQDTPEYKQRFKANQDRINKGLQVLSPAEYLNLEDGYRQILRAYGLKQFDNDAYVNQFIANDVSAAELSDRVVTAVQRVQNADPAIQRQLRDYYGIGSTDLVAYVLDPNQQLPKIQRQVAAAEIGVAAAKQGLTAGVSVAEQLAAQGVTQAEAQRGYATIADILPTAEKLSQIYSSEAGYGQAEAEQDVFNQLADAQRKRQRLVSSEVSTFGGRSGLSKNTLGQQTAGQL